ncbi:MAG: hypothetical protein J0L96_03145 [Anaerolineae bacterium]|nr:hypothetical protein [Anaerolineae bacterium]
MNNFQHQKLYNTLNKKDSTELLKIWELNNRLAWSEEAFQVVKQILQERQITPPEQSSQAHKPTEVPSKKHPSKTKNTLVLLKHTIAELRQRYSYLIAYIFYISLTTVSAWLLSFFTDFSSHPIGSYHQLWYFHYSRPTTYSSLRITGISR